jgi:AcrR family transcriptional regulator
MARISQEKKIATQKQILENATRLFLAQGYEGTACADISRLCGIAQGTLYNYYPTKEALLLAVLQGIKPVRETPQPRRQAPSVSGIVTLTLSLVDELCSLPYPLLLELCIAALRNTTEGNFLLESFLLSDRMFMEEISQGLEALGSSAPPSLAPGDLARILYGHLLAEIILHIRSQTFEQYPTFRAQLATRLEALITLYSKT